MPRFGGIIAATPKTMQSLENFSSSAAFMKVLVKSERNKLYAVWVSLPKKRLRNESWLEGNNFFCAVLCFANVFVLPGDNLEGMRCKCIERKRETSKISKAERRSNDQCLFKAEREMGISKAEKQKDSDMVSLLSSFILLLSGYIAPRTWRIQD
jgi:hypothetical protein